MTQRQYRITKLNDIGETVATDHIHKRMKGFQFCKCGEYLGMKRKFVTIKWLAGDINK
jgi:hypothetical protein